VSNRNFLLSCGLALFPLIFLSCATVRLPNVPDYRLERQVAEEVGSILGVTEDKDRAPTYRILLSDFPREDILGMSVGGRRIYISYNLARLALQNQSPRHRWLLRQILAHEIAHEIAGHANSSGGAAFDRSAPGRGVTAADIGLSSDVEFRHYSMEKELEADLNGMTYWSKLHWDCRIWVGILQRFEEDNYQGDIFHPTDKRLLQALRACPQAGGKTASPRAEPRLLRPVND
jgi:predicted Zn-dependent protease